VDSKQTSSNWHACLSPDIFSAHRVVAERLNNGEAAMLLAPSFPHSCPPNHSPNVSDAQVKAVIKHEAVGVCLRRWWAPKVASEATPQAVGGAPWHA
jgi:hypothetical protein